MRELAEMLGGKTKSQTIANWITRGVPKERCLVIENLTGVRCEELRPDIDWSDLQDVLVARVRRSLDASDDTQGLGGTSDRKTKECKLAA
jgi:DNA-binding transcriptional regulator YdaS (Cro superfamily)